MIHTGDVSHLSKPQESDEAAKIIARGKLDVHYVPGEHDLLDEEAKLYREREADFAANEYWSMLMVRAALIPI